MLLFPSDLSDAARAARAGLGAAAHLAASPPAGALGSRLAAAARSAVFADAVLAAFKARVENLKTVSRT